MARFGILSRLLLILLSAVVSLSAASLMLLHLQASHHLRPAPFLRVKQFAADADLLGMIAPTARPAALRVSGSQQIRLTIADGPPSLAGFIPAPKLEAKLHGFAHTPTGAATRVYTSPDQTRRAPEDRVEGFMALAVAVLPDGRYLIATPNLPPDRGAVTLVGIPTALWIGLSGALVAMLAVYGAVREMRPLRRLAGSLDAFSGATPPMPPTPEGAPEVQALARAIGAMQHRVSDLMRQRTLMLGAVSHDLRTPLTRMQLRVLTLSDETLRNRFAADLDAMSAMIEDALAYARGADVKLIRKPLDLSDLVATEIAEREALGGDLSIEAILSDAPIAGDAVSLRRVIANLIDNALRFKRTRVRVTVLRDHGGVRFSVEDDGPGVPLEEREAILEPFHRVEGSRSRATGGAGLGLAIAHRIIEAHDGRIVIASSELGGALAEVALPSAL